MKLEYITPTSPKIPQCAELERKTLPTPWSEDSIVNMSPQGRYIAATIDERVVGICSYYLVCDELELVNIAVDESVRKQGVGKAMMEKMLEEDFSVCSLEVAEDNFGAMEFYKTFGFLKVGKRKNFYKNKDAVIMILQKG
jgi:ribosomal-protein-alanine N-acetyltransferase